MPRQDSEYCKAQLASKIKDIRTTNSAVNVLLADRLYRRLVSTTSDTWQRCPSDNIGNLSTAAAVYLDCVEV